MMTLTKEDILHGLRNLDARAKASHVLIDLAIYGGAAMAMAFDVRRATRDVDAIVRGSPEVARILAEEIADEEGWPPDWLNDGVKGFVSEYEDMRLMQDFMGSPVGGRLHLPSPEYLFAMKCMAMRPEGLDGSHDISDIEALAMKIGFRTPSEALALVEAFYPASRIPPKVRFGVEEIMDLLLPSRSDDGKARIE